MTNSRFRLAGFALAFAAGAASLATSIASVSAKVGKYLNGIVLDFKIVFRIGDDIGVGPALAYPGIGKIDGYELKHVAAESNISFLRKLQGWVTSFLKFRRAPRLTVAGAMA